MTTFGLSELCDLEAAVRRVEDLAASPDISEEARVAVAVAASDLVAVMDLNPGPTAAALAGEPVDIDATASACVRALENLVCDLCDPAATGLSPMDVVVVSAAIGDASRFITALAPLR